MTTPENSLEVTKSLDEKILLWFDRVDNYSKSNKKDEEATEGFLTQGYGLFFEILEPLKDTDWIQAEQPDINHKVYLNSTAYQKLSKFSDLFGKDLGILPNTGWAVQIYNYKYKKEYYGNNLEAKIKLGCDTVGPHGKKLIQVMYSPRDDRSISAHGQMYIEDTKAFWLRYGANGNLETVKVKNIYDYSGLSICELAVGLADGFVKKYTAEQQAMVPQSV